jgi:hypothetical protein
MTQDTPTPAKLLAIVDDSLRLLNAEQTSWAGMIVPHAPFQSLYGQCLELCKSIDHRQLEPVRTVHHFACTGGTIVCRYLAATPNARLFSEIDPLSPLIKPHFSPSDLILHLRSLLQPVGDTIIEETFLAGLSKIQEHMVRHGERLILRDHTHSHYCTGASLPERNNLRQIILRQFPLRSVTIVRHPLDSFLSLRANGWLHFQPQTLEEYARRYLVFLDAYSDIPITTYESFVDDPDAALQVICAQLDLAYIPDLAMVAPAITLTGNSGRKGDSVEKRKRRQIPADLEDIRSNGTYYREMCDRLGYDF